MLKIFAAVLLATSIYSGAASARGGGPAETMPATNYTDMPSYRPSYRPVSVEPLRRIKHRRKHARSHRSPAPDSFVGRIFCEKTGGHFSGKCSKN